MFLYHAVPHTMIGTTLYPLNRLAEVSESLFQNAKAKYLGREHLMEQRIPLLDCLFNDVLFLTAVHPNTFRASFESAGFHRDKPFRAFQIDTDILDRKNMAVIITMRENEPLEYEMFNPVNYATYARIPNETIEYWKTQKNLGNKRPFLYLHIPHILYRGTLDVSNAPIIES